MNNVSWLSYFSFYHIEKHNLLSFYFPCSFPLHETKILRKWYHFHISDSENYTIFFILFRVHFDRVLLKIVFIWLCNQTESLMVHTYKDTFILIVCRHTRQTETLKLYLKHCKIAWSLILRSRYRSHKIPFSFIQFHMIIRMNTWHISKRQQQIELFAEAKNKDVHLLINVQQSFLYFLVLYAIFIILCTGN